MFESWLQRLSGHDTHVAKGNGHIVKLFPKRFMQRCSTSLLAHLLCAFSRAPVRATLNPKPKTLNPKPYTLILRACDGKAFRSPHSSISQGLHPQVKVTKAVAKALLCLEVHGTQKPT